MNRRKALLVLGVVVALVALGVWSYSSAPGSSRLTAAKSSTTVGANRKKKRKHKSCTTTVPVRPTTTVAPNPDAYSTALFGYWKKRDCSAVTVATPAVVRELFLRPWHEADAWVVHGCKSAAGATYCTWTSPRRRFVMTVGNSSGGLPILVSMQIFH
jgi:hypothetical protein